MNVSDNGLITLPLIGVVTAGGNTAQQIERNVAQRLRKYLQSPQVTVLVLEYNSQNFTVEGSVIQPGVYSIKGQTTLMQAIASAKGLGPLADASSVYMFRQINGRKYAARFDLNKIRSGNLPDPTLQTKDIVYVEESGSKRFFEYLKPFLSPATSFVR